MVSVPFSWGMVLHRAGASALRGVRIEFQSPSRGGWSCIGVLGIPPVKVTARFSPLLVGDGLASQAGYLDSVSVSACFSPLLVGDGLASPRDAGLCSINIPFQSPSRGGWSCIILKITARCSNSSCFSPLLVGDGLASGQDPPAQSRKFAVSVPFSWGMVLHRAIDVRDLDRHLVFQSPSRGGWSCI